MPKVTNKVGPNSYCITVTQGTTADQLLDSIIDIVKIQVDNKPAHGWIVERVDSEITTTIMGVSHTFIRVAWLKGLCEDGVTVKYVLLGVKANIILTMVSPTPNYSDAINFLPYMCYVTGYASYKHAIGLADNWMYIPPNDRYDMMVFIHPRWFATTCIAYSSKELTYFNPQETNSSFKAFGLIGSFEMFDSAFGKKFALINTLQTLAREESEDWNVRRYCGAAFDKTVTQSLPNLNMGAKREGVEDANGVAHTAYQSGRLSKTNCVMLDLYKCLNWNDRGINYGSLFGLKLASNTHTKLLGINFVKSNPNTYSIDVNGTPLKHFCIPSWFKSNLANMGNDDRKASFFIPA